MARSLKVAVQMDPIETIGIDGDSSFALMLPPRRAAIGSGTTKFVTSCFARACSRRARRARSGYSRVPAR